ncbi:unnamed protein product [Oikopleura dioica]|uniref:Uncharacterized protein n=1 Tax=Oikopleura dioica TaxID=34765 RepID=E4XUC0_OIKDI|nr:unnamed protein product [Oikopleura dioica]
MKSKLLKLQVVIALATFLCTWKAFPEHSLRFPKKFGANTVLSSFIEASNYPNYELKAFFSFIIRPFMVFVVILSSTLSFELSFIAFSYLFVNFAFLQTLQQSESIYCLLLFCLQSFILIIGADGPLSWGISTLLFVEFSVLMSSFIQPAILIFMPLMLYMTQIYGTGSKPTRRFTR